MYDEYFKSPVTQSDELEHFGVVGMKWGVRRYQNPDGSLTAEGQKKYNRPTKEERRETRTLKRQTAAAVKNLVEKGNTYADAAHNVVKAERNYQKASKKMYLFKKNRLAAIKAASEELTNALEMAQAPTAEKMRADKIYKETAKKLLENNKRMIEKYGSENVKEIGTKNVLYGKKLVKEGWFSDTYEAFVDEVLNTGLTVVNIPWYGQRYTGKYVGPKEMALREKEFQKQAKKRY